MSEIEVKEIEELRKKLDKEAEEAGYHLNPNLELTRQLLRGLLVNQKRYGYMSCPCRLASGVKKEDLDIICPCDYRDPDLSQFGTCFCGLYVSEEVVKGKKKIGSIPERRPKRGERKKVNEKPEMKTGKMPVWRCKVCGYLCAREEPPEVCPICKAEKERFERFM
jgi:ferredoxin-thioredoxin reductase catalytic subunit